MSQIIINAWQQQVKQLLAKGVEHARNHFVQFPTVQKQIFSDIEITLKNIQKNRAFNGDFIQEDQMKRYVSQVEASMMEYNKIASGVIHKEIKGPNGELQELIYKDDKEEHSHGGCCH